MSELSHALPEGQDASVHTLTETLQRRHRRNCTDPNCLDEIHTIEAEKREQTHIGALEDVIHEVLGDESNYNTTQKMRVLANHILLERAKLADYRNEVAAEAWRYAVRYDWCDEVRECLRALGISMDSPTVEAEVTVTYRISGKVGFDHLRSLREGGAGFLMSQLHIPAAVVEGVWEAGLTDPSSIRVENYTVTSPAVQA